MGAPKFVQGAWAPGSDTLTPEEGEGGKVDAAPLVKGSSHRGEVWEKQARGD